jgi:hypothetical protein
MRNNWLELSESPSGQPVIVNMEFVQMITADATTTLWFDDCTTLAVRESLARMLTLLGGSRNCAERKPPPLKIVRPAAAAKPGRPRH